MFLKTLNPMQREAATFGDGPLLVIAGAGSGKTKVLACRAAYIVKHKGVPSRSVLAVTFTNKAAGEMKERLFGLIGDRAKDLWLGTFHSLGLRMLRIEGDAIGMGKDLTVYNDDDQLSLVKQTMAELNMSDKAFSPRAVLTRIDQAKNENMDPLEFLASTGDFLSERVAKVYSLYQRRLKEMNAADFGDLICAPLRLLGSNPQILKRYQERFLYVLVDEYQDTNRAQHLLTNLLAGLTRNLFAVGDPDQSIYAWRGACIKNMLDFERDYPDATVLRLEQNYRSTKNILGAANSVIQRNSRRMEKSLWTENPEGMPVTFEEAPDEYAEARLVIKRIKGLLNGTEGMQSRDMAVFYRTNAQSRVFEEELMAEGMPYAVIGGTRFYDRKEIRDAVAYLRFIANPKDLLSFTRAINTPARHIGKVSLDKITAISNERGVSLLDALKEAMATGVLQKNAKAREFINAVEGFEGGRDRLKKDATALLDNAAEEGALPGKAMHDRTLKLLEGSGYMRMLQEEGTEEAFERIENLFEFVSAIKAFEAREPLSTLSEFLDHVSLVSDLDGYEEGSDRLTLMTIHSSKGLEFRAVFIAGMEERLFPHSRSSDDEEELEEERRLCYVGMTRAKEKLFLFAARSRSIYGEARPQDRSRFVGEIDPDFVRIIEPLGAVFSRSGGGRASPGPSAFAAGARSNEVYYTSEGSQVDRFGGADEDGVEDPWRVGMKVKHPAFGLGVIKEKSGTGPDVKLTIRFFDAGVKRLAVRYAVLTPAG